MGLSLFVLIGYLVHSATKSESDTREIKSDEGKRDQTRGKESEKEKQEI